MSCGRLWSPCSGAEGAEGGDVNWRQNCQSALNAVIETFNTSMQLYTQGDHEHYREREQPPHAHAHLGHGHQPQRNLLSVAGSQGSAHGLMKSKGMSKVSVYICTLYVQTVCVCMLIRM